MGTLSKLLIVMLASNVSALKQHQRADIALVQEVSFDPAVDDTKLNPLDAEPEVEDPKDTADLLAKQGLTKEDLADAQYDGQNDMASCTIELNDHFFNFNSLSL